LEERNRNEYFLGVWGGRELRLTTMDEQAKKTSEQPHCRILRQRLRNGRCKGPSTPLRDPLGKAGSMGLYTLEAMFFCSCEDKEEDDISFSLILKINRILLHTPFLRVFHFVYNPFLYTLSDSDNK
jgi:hypothetical protein